MVGTFDNAGVSACPRASSPTCGSSTSRTSMRWATGSRSEESPSGHAAAQHPVVQPLAACQDHPVSRRHPHPGADRQQLARRHLRRLAVVRRGWFPRRFLGDHRHPSRAVRRLRPADGLDDRRQHGRGLPAATAVPSAVLRAAEPRALPRCSRAAKAARAHPGYGHRVPGCRLGRAGQLANLDAVALRRQFRGQGSAVRPRYFVLRLGLPGLPAAARVRLHRGVLLSWCSAIAVHYLYGAIRLQTPGPKITLSARRHLTILSSSSSCSRRSRTGWTATGWCSRTAAGSPARPIPTSTRRCRPRRSCSGSRSSSPSRCSPACGSRARGCRRSASVCCSC